VIRLNDFDNIPVVSLPKLSALPHPHHAAAAPRRSPSACWRRGAAEAVTFSFMPSAV
jgi:hypothetical protein